MSQVGATSNTSSVSFQSVTGMRSPQMALAMLMMKLSEANKESAMAGIKEIEAEQAKKKDMAELLNQAREYASGNYTKNAKDTSHTSSAFDKKIQDLGFSVPNDSDKDKNKAQWDKLIAQIQTKMDTVGADLQTKMVQLQDMMGQYNSYLQGANSAIAKSNEVLSALAQGR